MKKNRIFFFLTLAIVMVAMLSACSTEEVIDGGAKKHQLTISVKDGLFTSQPETRTSPSGADGLGTIFTINDKIGIFGVKDGKVMADVCNVCYTCDGHLWNGNKTIVYDSEATYYAYYPWNSDEDLKKIVGVANVTDVVDPTKTEAEEFFQPLIGKWNPKMDQSKIEDYNASDLMVSIGTAPTGEAANQYTMAFTMDHQMGLCLTTLEEVNYVVNANYSFKLMPNYEIVGDVKPCYYQGKYRYIVYPEINREFKVSTGSDTYKINFFVKKKGNYTEHTVGGSTKEYQPQVGDIYYSDGSMTHGTQISRYKRQVGVVGYTAKTASDDVLEGYINGLVICGLTVDAPSAGALRFSSEGRNILDKNGAVTIYCNADIFKNFKGKEITQKMSDSGCYIGSNSLKVSDVLTKFNTNVPLNQNSTAPNSGWFIPASAQAYAIINALYNENEGTDIGLDNEEYSKQDARTPVAVKSVNKKVNDMLERLGVGHYKTFDYWSTLSTLCYKSGTKYQDDNFINSFQLQENSLNCFNNVNEYRPILAF